MKYFFDESGDFRPVDNSEPGVGIIAGITIPESSEDEVFRQFDVFVASLSASAFKNGEPKGNRLSVDERDRFSQMVAENPKIVVTSAMLDLPSLARSKKDVQGSLVRKMRCLAERCIHDSMRTDATLLAAQLKNLSINQSLRLGALAYCIKRAFEHSIIALGESEFFDCWENLRFEIDPVRVRPGNSEELVFKWTMLGWLQAWSEKQPTMTITEIHTSEHPLIKNFSTANDKFDLVKIYRDNIHYQTSKSSKGLQMADLSASIIRQVVYGITTSENLMSFGRLLKNNWWSAEMCPGIFCLTDTSDVDMRHYQGLTQAIAKARGGCEWQSAVHQGLGL